MVTKLPAFSFGVKLRGNPLSYYSTYVNMTTAIRLLVVLSLAARVVRHQYINNRYVNEFRKKFKVPRHTFGPPN